MCDWGKTWKINPNTFDVLLLLDLSGVNLSKNDFRKAYAVLLMAQIWFEDHI